MNNDTRRFGSSGYTLIELMVVLVLIAVIASLAAPSLSGVVARQATRGALDRVAGDLALARMAAVRGGRSTVVSFAGGGAYYVTQPGAAADTVKRVNLRLDYPGVEISVPASSVSFDSRGLLTGVPGSGYFVASRGVERDSLLITATGRVYREY